jgi:hypothetical protein
MILNGQFTVGHWSLATGNYFSFAPPFFNGFAHLLFFSFTGHWSLVTGHWSLVTGHWPLVTGH